MVPRSLFLDFSLKHASGDYFLRPGCVLGAFHLDPAKPLDVTDAAQRLLDKAIHHINPRQVIYEDAYKK